MLTPQAQSLDEQLDSLDLSEDERRFLEQMIAEVPTGFGTRTAFMDVVPSMVGMVAPQHQAASRAFRSRFSRGTMFSFSPVAEVTLTYCHAGRLLFPERDVIEGAVDFILAAYQPLVNVPLLKPVLKACEGNPQLFLDAATQTGASLFFNKGTAYHLRQGQNQSLVRYEGYPARAMAPLLRGFYGGLLPHLTGNADAGASFETLGPALGELTLSW